jgi:hypothetical protein
MSKFDTCPQFGNFLRILSKSVIWPSTGMIESNKTQTHLHPSSRQT